MARLEVVCGPMFSGKTETLIKRVSTKKHFHGWKTAVFKPVTDTRHMTTEVISHDGTSIEAQWLERDASNLPLDVQLIALDEVQFFSGDVIPRLLEALRAGVCVVAAGLDLTFKAEPFGPMPALLALADEVTKLTSRCARCHQPATRTQRIARGGDTVLVGGAESYEPRCFACFEVKVG